jgi:hypothetical protein
LQAKDTGNLLLYFRIGSAATSMQRIKIVRLVEALLTKAGVSGSKNVLSWPYSLLPIVAHP